MAFPHALGRGIYPFMPSPYGDPEPDTTADRDKPGDKKNDHDCIVNQDMIFTYKIDYKGIHDNSLIRQFIILNFSE